MKFSGEIPGRTLPNNSFQLLITLYLALWTPIVRGAFQILHLNIDQPRSLSFELENEPRYIIGITTQSCTTFITVS